MMPGMVTLNVLKIARVFVQASSTCVFTGYGISKQLGMDPTSVWGTLKELEGRGWLTSELVDKDGRSRRLYSITNQGRESAIEHLAPLQIAASPLMARSA